MYVWTALDGPAAGGGAGEEEGTAAGVGDLTLLSSPLLSSPLLSSPLLSSPLLSSPLLSSPSSLSPGLMTRGQEPCGRGCLAGETESSTVSRWEGRG